MPSLAFCPLCGKLIALAFPLHDCTPPTPPAPQRIGRVTWDDLYPRATYGDEPRPGIVFGGKHPHECWRCGRLTHWDSLYWEAPVCSFICDDLAWHEYGRDVWGPGWDTWPSNLPPQVSPLDRPRDTQTGWAEDGPVPDPRTV